jgi:hypothetical protein
MTKYISIRKTIGLTTLFGLMAILAGCGGGGDSKKQQDNNCLDNIVFFFLCAASSSTDDSSTAGKSSAESTVASTTTFTSVDEYEPNNVLSNANIMALPTGSAGTPHGLELSGSVRQLDDASDYYVFTPNQSGSHTILLCSETCAGSVEDDAAYIMIYDQSQTTIASTPIGTRARQEITAELTAGLAYYVEVNGYNAGAQQLDYRLAIVD